MKTFAIVMTTAFLAATIASAFSSDAYAARRGTMTGHDNTYGTTHSCIAGHCKLRTPKATKKPPKAQ
jgi:hypothetical protein